MRRIVSRHRIATATITLLILLSGSAILFYPRIARAFTLFPSTIFFDPISVTTGQTLHVHFVNQFGATPYGIFVTCKPTSAALGSPVSGAAVAVNPGDGVDQSFPFVGFSPSPATTRIPVVCKIEIVVPPSGMPPHDFSGRVASSVEIIDDVTGRPTEIITTHHVLLGTNPCEYCN